MAERALSVEGKVTDSTLHLEGVITISKAESMHHELEEAIRLGGNITLNAESCERVDTSVLQLLTCFVKEAQEKELKIAWAGASDSFRSGMTLLGLSECLQLDAS